MSDCFFNTRKIRNARLILNQTNQSIFCTSSAPMSVSSALFCTAVIPNVTDIAMHILCASRRTCSLTYSLLEIILQYGRSSYIVGRALLRRSSIGSNGITGLTWSFCGRFAPTAAFLPSCGFIPPFKIIKCRISAIPTEMMFNKWQCQEQCY